MGTPASRRRDGVRDRGAAAVEFGLVLPILLLLVFGIIQYGLYFWAVQGGSDLARDAVRMAAVGEDPACAALRSRVAGQMGPFAKGAPSVSRTYDNADPTPGVQIGEHVTVTVRFQSLDLHFPFIPLPEDGAVTSTAEARVENVTTAPEACS